MHNARDVGLGVLPSDFQRPRRPGKMLQRKQGIKHWLWNEKDVETSVVEARNIENLIKATRSEQRQPKRKILRATSTAKPKEWCHLGTLEFTTCYNFSGAGHWTTIYSICPTGFWSCFGPISLYFPVPPFRMKMFILCHSISTLFNFFYF